MLGTRLCIVLCIYIFYGRRGVINHNHKIYKNSVILKAVSSQTVKHLWLNSPKNKAPQKGKGARRKTSARRPEHEISKVTVSIPCYSLQLQHIKNWILLRRTWTSRRSIYRISTNHVPYLLIENHPEFIPPDGCWQLPATFERTIIPVVTTNEQLEICRRIDDNRTPGLEGISSRVVMQRAHAREDISYIMEYQKLVRLPKFDEPPDQVPFYRAVCLLDTIGKMLERVIHQTDHFERMHGI